MRHHDHKSGIHEAFLVKRHLRLWAVTPMALESALARLLETPGVDRARVDRKRLRMDVTYDASTVNLDRVLEVIESAGCTLSNNWWSRSRHNWYRSRDENMRGHAAKGVWSRRRYPPGAH